VLTYPSERITSLPYTTLFRSLDVGHAARGLEDRVDLQRLGQAGPGLELGQDPVDVVDVLGALHLGDHDHVELDADRRDERGEVRSEEHTSELQSREKLVCRLL